MKRVSAMDLLLILCCACSILLNLLIRFIAGAISPSLICFLSLCASSSSQWLFLRQFKHKALCYLPSFFALLLAIWGSLLYCISPAWQYATLAGLLIDYLIPWFGTLLATGGYALNAARKP